MMLPRGCPAAARPSTIAFTMSWCVVKSSPPAAEILIPMRSPGDTSDPHAFATSDCPVTAITRRLTISRTTCGFVLYCLIESGLRTAYTIEGVGAALLALHHPGGDGTKQ